MRVAIYTLTRDRLDYTKKCFQLLHDKAGYEFDHYVVDNGSKDGTVEWLLENRGRFYNVIYNPENVGISVGSNQALAMIFSWELYAHAQYDLVVKFDNDCEIISDGILAKMVEIYQIYGQPILLSPRVEGINRQPVRGYTLQIGDYTVGRTGIVGGLFHFLNAGTYRRYIYPEDLPKAKGQDDHFCDWVYKQDIPIGYVEELLVRHIDGTNGQYEKYPGYFERKWGEEIGKN